MPGDLHDALTRQALVWLLNTGFPVVCDEVPLAQSGQEDAVGIGLVDGQRRCACIEAKASRSDFLRDRKKWHRQKAFVGDSAESEWDREYEIGGVTEWYYIAPKGMLSPEEIPRPFGLLEWDAARDEVLVARLPQRFEVRPGSPRSWPVNGESWENGPKRSHRLSVEARALHKRLGAGAKVVWEDDWVDILMRTMEYLSRRHAKELGVTQVGRGFGLTGIAREAIREFFFPETSTERLMESDVYRVEVPYRQKDYSAGHGQWSYRQDCERLLLCAGSPEEAAILAEDALGWDGMREPLGGPRVFLVLRAGEDVAEHGTHGQRVEPDPHGLRPGGSRL